MKRRLLVSFLAACACATGCAPAGSVDRIAALEGEVAQLKATLDEQRSLAAEERKAVAEFMNAGETITLRRTDQGYDALWHDLGVFAIELASVTPTADGSEVRLRVGNILAAAVNNVEARIEWGTDAEAVAANSQRMSLGRVLPQSAWSEVTLTLDGIAPMELGFLRISELTIGSVSLRRPAGRPAR